MPSTRSTSSRTMPAPSTLRLLCFFWVIFLAGPAGFAQEASDSILERWRDTLRFGVDSTVTAVIDEMQDAEDDRLADELVELFPSSRSAVQIRTIDFFIAMELDSLREAVEEELLFYQDLPANLVRKYLSYLEDFAPSDATEITEVLVEITEGTNAELAAGAVAVLGMADRIDEHEFYTELFDEDDQSIQVRVAAVRALARFSGDAVLDFLEDIAEDQVQETLIRQEALRSIGAIAADRSLALLRRLLDSDDPFIRASVLSALVDYDQQDTVDLYRSALRDSFWRVRLSVLQTLEEKPLADLEAMIIYISRNDPETPVKTQAYKTLGEYATDRVWEAFEEDLQQSRVAENYKLQILEMLIRNRFSQSRSVIEPIIEAEWAKPSSRLLDIIGRTLSAGSHPEAADIFLRFLDHGTPVIKIYGIRGLGNTGNPEFRSRLEELTAEGVSPVLRQNAQDAVEKLRL